jgi:hypothetical protein
MCLSKNGLEKNDRVSFRDRRLSMLCTKTERASFKILECNSKAYSGVFEINVNNKMLKVALFQGPNDEIVELIEFKR